MLMRLVRLAAVIVVIVAVSSSNVAQTRSVHMAQSRCNQYDYYEDGTIVTSTYEAVKKNEESAVSGGHMTWREEPSWAAAANTTNLLPPTRKDHKSTFENVTVGDHEDIYRATPKGLAKYELSWKDGTDAFVNVTINGRPEYKIVLERPFGHWWYVVDVSRSDRKQITVFLDGKLTPVSPSPVLKGGRVFVPVTVFRSIGLGVQFRKPREAVVYWPESDFIIDYKAGVPRYEGQEKGVWVSLPGTPFMRRGVLMVPLKSMLSSYLTADWDPRARSLVLNRSMYWLRYRIGGDEEYVRDPRDGYSHVWLGNVRPIVPSLVIIQAKKQYAMGNREKAIEMLHSLIRVREFNWASTDPRYHDEWQAYKPLGEMLLQDKHTLDEANLYLGIGKALERDYAGAEALFRKGVEANPKNLFLQFAVGWAILRNEKPDTVFDRKPETLHEALSYFNKALEINRDFPPALRYAGWTSISLAYVTAHESGYSDDSKCFDQSTALKVPFFRNAVKYFGHLLEITKPNPELDKIVSQLNDRLKAAQAKKP